MTTTSNFLKRIKAHRDGSKTEKFSGVLKDYLKLLESRPLDRDWETLLVVVIA